MKKRTVYLKYIALIVLVTFTFTFALPINQLAAAEQTQQTQQLLQTQLAQTENQMMPNQSTSHTENSGKSQAKTRLGSFTAELGTWVVKFQTDLDSGNLSQLKNDIKDAKLALKDIRAGISSELAENEKTLQKLNTPNARDRHNKFKAELENKLDIFAALFDKLDEIAAVLKDLKGGGATPEDAAQNAAQLEILKTEIAEINNLLNPEQAAQPLGTLPHNNVSVTPPSPATGAAISAAYMGSSSDSTTSALPVTPTTEDLAETDEVKFAQATKDLADSLNTPVGIYEYVRNNINFEPYYGSRKGSIGTLEQMAGNDYDQASLLISLLRYKGIPARYVRGIAEIPVEKVQGWTGAETAEAAVKALGSLGIPLVSLVSGGTISAVRLEHVWAEAYVPYENYRGTGAVSGQGVWLPLDPSFKQYQKLPGMNLEEITGLSGETYKSLLQNLGETSADGWAKTNIQSTEISNLLAGTEQQINQYITDNGLTQTTFEQIYGGSKIIPENLGLLPLSLPYKTVEVQEESVAITDNHADQVMFSLKGADPFGLNFGGSADFQYCSKAAALYGKKLTLSWAAATTEDADLINQYGGIFNVPAYLVQLKPQLKADEETIAVGKPVGLGYRQQFVITINGENITNAVTAGSIYSIGLNFGQTSEKELQNTRTRLSNAQAAMNEENIYSSEITGEILSAAAHIYFSQVDAISKIIATKAQVKATRLLSEAMTGYEAKVNYLFMVPVELSSGSFNIDVDANTFGVVSLNGSQETEKSYMITSGIVASALEHGIYEQILNVPSVSTIKILSEANQQGIPLYTVTKDTLSSVISKLNVVNSVKSDITAAVNNGRTVIIPAEEIRYYNWQGSGYIVLDEKTGSAAYMISGGLAGGSAALNVIVALATLTTIIMTAIDIGMLSIALITATNPLAGMLWGTLLLVNIYILNETVKLAQTYYDTGDPAAAKRIMIDAVLNVALFGAAKVLEKILPQVIRMMDEAVIKLKSENDDFLNYLSGKIVRLREGIGFKPALAGVGETEDTLTVLKFSEINNLTKIESIAEAAGRYVNIDEIAPDITNLVEYVRFRGTVLDLIDKSGNTIRRAVIPEGYRSTQQLLYKAFSGEIDVTRWGYTNANKMDDVISNTNRYLNRSDLNSIPSLRNSKYAGKTVDFENGIVVEFDPIGFPIFKGTQVKTELSILEDTIVVQKGLSIMSGSEHRISATRSLKEMIQEEADSAGILLIEYLKVKGFDDIQINDIICEREKITGFTWHHHQESGRMQLVDETTHRLAGHNGGNSLWGNGTEDY
jgi:transglutaminase-like putative cysteine protease